ncbi:acyl carrier protein [Streptomyces fragilis]|uniref:Phosphopantetheine-binding protein n=1 Tax=Streptomyces fragilis TaxID=67301 RepID=A0ABV2YIP1_9ACTN|nr:phosphopantetheine-binding protein [Streptomyces fragilis]
MFEQFKSLLVDKLKVSPELITPEATREDIELDSLAVVELSLMIESEFQASVSDDELLETQTVGEMVALMESRGAKI